MSVGRNKIEKNLQQIRENIAAACARRRRDAADVTLIGVTKTIDSETIKALLDAGVTELGESRVQQIIERTAEVDAYVQRRRSDLPAAVRWHMIGHLQRNKVKAVLEAGVNIIHSLDSLRLAEEINLRAEKLGLPGQERRVDVLIEVNCSNEPQKFGVAVGATMHLAEMVTTLKNLRLVGLMTMAAASDDPESARPAFLRLRELFEDIRHDRIGGADFRHLSMGMSHDYVVAVEEGATMVRIGTALFD